MPAPRKHRRGRHKVVPVMLNCRKCHGVVLCHERLYTKSDAISSKTRATCVKGHRLLVGNNLVLPEAV